MTILTRGTLAAFLAVGLIATTARPAAARCNVDGCTLNSAELRGVKIRGLNVQGQYNIDGARLVPGSLILAAGLSLTCGLGLFYPRTGYNLDVENGAFFTRNRYGEPIPPECLIGATFDVDIPMTKGSLNWLVRDHIKIAAARTVSTWFTNPAQVTAVPSYQLIDTSTNQSMCPVRSWVESWQDTPHTADGSRWREATDEALLVQGETYDDSATVDSTRTGRDWFNIACIGTAIAKMRLFGYDPMSTWSTSAERSATLKMITGRYPPNSNQAYTITGTPVLWIPARAFASASAFDLAWYLAHPYYYGLPISTAIGPVEAMWPANGTMCLSHLRFWTATSHPTVSTYTESDDLAAIRGAGGGSACTTLTTPGAYWWTFTVDHID